MMPRAQSHGGLTLIESLVAAAILAMVVIAVAVPFAAARSNEQADARMTMAAHLAQEMMEEVLSRPFSDGVGVAGKETGETRATFNCMDDYDGYTEAAGAIAAADGRLCTDPAAAGLSRVVSAKYTKVQGSPNNSYMRIVVTIKYQNQPLLSIARLAYSH
jgi:Tfp pilus assembly protein PilV